MNFVTIFVTIFVTMPLTLHRIKLRMYPPPHLTQHHRQCPTLPTINNHFQLDLHRNSLPHVKHTYLMSQNFPFHRVQHITHHQLDILLNIQLNLVRLRRLRLCVTM